MNRPHVAAALDVIAFAHLVAEVAAVTDDPDIRAFLETEVLPRLRVRAGEIEAGGGMGPTDETRWRAAGRSTEMTLEQRAEFIAGASHNRPGGPRWKLIRDR